MTDQPKPLWQVMSDAYYSVTQHPDVLSEECERLTIAAEIEAVRDWLVPEEPNPCSKWERKIWPNDVQAHSMCVKSEKYFRWDERQRLRALLTEQARIAREGK